MCPLSVSYVLPSVCHPCIPLIISPVGPPHRFVVLSSVSVYLVSVFPSLLVWSLYSSASVCVHAPIHASAPVHVLCVPLVCVHWILISGFLMLELNFVLPFSCYFASCPHFFFFFHFSHFFPVVLTPDFFFISIKWINSLT